MHVVHVINRFGWSGGAENQLLMNLTSFRDPELTHSVIALYRHNEPTLAGNNTVPAPVKYLFDESDQPSRYSIYSRLKDRLRDLRPDLIHASLSDAALASRVIVAQGRTPLVESLVNLSYEPIRLVDNPAVKPWKLEAYRRLDRLTMRYVTRFHALSEGVAESWSRYVGIDRARITVIPRGVDVMAFDPSLQGDARSLLRSELALGETAPIILNVARQEPQKGQRYLLAAMPEILSKLPESVLVLVGRPGNSSPGLNKLIDHLGIGSSVYQLGVRTDVKDLMMAADVFAFPSLYEGLGVSLIEAMAACKACVVADVPPMREVVEPDLSALMVPPRSPSPMAAAIVRLLEDKALRTKLGVEGRRIAESRFRIEDTSQRIERLYKTVGSSR